MMIREQEWYPVPDVRSWVYGPRAAVHNAA